MTPARFAALAGLVYVLSFFLTVDDLAKEDGFLAWLVLDSGVNFINNLVGVVFALLPLLVVGNLGPQRGWRRYAALTMTLLLLAVPMATMVRGWWVTFVGDQPLLPMPAEFFVPVYSRFLVWLGALTAVSEFYRTRMRSVEAMHQAEVDRVALEQQMAEARLQVLQAQIEPHFLFNALASVRRLYQVDGRRGRVMLDNLMRYLEVALPRMREGSSTLERETALIESYLNVQKIRMAGRLEFELDVPQNLREIAVPPMMLLTLVENAIKHGLAPLPEGGRVDVRARRNQKQLQLDVVDTGTGFRTSGGAGTGLANTRARLASQFGSRASLTLSPNKPHGIKARIILPLGSPT